jgi:hypothetical protein
VVLIINRFIYPETITPLISGYRICMLYVSWKWCLPVYITRKDGIIYFGIPDMYAIGLLEVVLISNLFIYPEMITPKISGYRIRMLYRNNPTKYIWIPDMYVVRFLDVVLIIFIKKRSHQRFLDNGYVCCTFLRSGCLPVYITRPTISGYWICMLYVSWK